MSDQSVSSGGPASGEAGSDQFDPGILGEVQVVRNGTATLVRLSGEVDLSLSEGLAQAYDECVAQARPVRVDMSALLFIDSTGIGFVARLAAAENTAGRRLSIIGASRRTSDTLSLTGLDDLLDLSPSV